MRILLTVAVAIASVGGLLAGQWSEASEAVSRDGTPLVTCRARLAGDYLVVEMRAADGWHVYAMDNEQRAQEALAGKMSLGIEQSTEVEVSGALQVVDEWLQTQPADFSQPALRWYSYGFAGTSLLAARVNRGDGDRATVQLRAQACDSASCVSVEALMEVSTDEDGGPEFDPTGLVRVRGS